MRRAPWHRVPQPEYERTKVCGSDSEANTCPRGSKNKTAARNRKVSESGDTRLSREGNPRSGFPVGQSHAEACEPEEAKGRRNEEKIVRFLRNEAECLSREGNPRSLKIEQFIA